MFYNLSADFFIKVQELSFLRTSNKCRSLDAYICGFLIMCIPIIMSDKNPLFLFIISLSSSLMQVKIQLNHTATIIIVQ